MSRYTCIPYLGCSNIILLLLVLKQPGFFHQTQKVCSVFTSAVHWFSDTYAGFYNARKLTTLTSRSTHQATVYTVHKTQMRLPKE